MARKGRTQKLRRYGTCDELTIHYTTPTPSPTTIGDKNFDRPKTEARCHRPALAASSPYSDDEWRPQLNINTPSVNTVSLKIKPNAGNLRALADVEMETPIGFLVLCQCRLIQKDGEVAFVLPPQTEWATPDGRKNYLPLVKWSPEVREAIKQAILEAWDAFPNGFEARSKPQPTTFRNEVQRRAGLNTSRYGEGQR